MLKVSRGRNAGEHVVQRHGGRRVSDARSPVPAVTAADTAASPPLRFVSANKHSD